MLKEFKTRRLTAIDVNVRGDGISFPLPTGRFVRSRGWLAIDEKSGLPEDLTGMVVPDGGRL